MPDTREMRKIAELQSLAGMERFSKRTIAEELKRHKLIELLKNGGVRDFPFNAVLADHLIAHGVTVQEWISVKDRLPPYNHDVLVYRPNMAMKIMVDSYNGYYGEDDNEWYEGWAKYGKDIHNNPLITHWQPMPQPPKGE